MSTNRMLSIGGVVLVLFLAGAAQLLSGREKTIPEQTALLPLFAENTGKASEISNTEAEKVPTNNSINKTVDLPLIAQGDTVASWNFKGVYLDNPELVAKAESEITRLSSLIGKGDYPDSTLYVAISGQYRLLGNGKQEYDYLIRAIQSDVTDGLPWHNIGVLMERLGALEAARVAYEKATLLQPARKTYHYAYLDFLMARMRQDSVQLQKAFAAAEQSIGDDPYILQLRAEWQGS